MAFHEVKTAEIIISLENYLKKHRPPEDIRHELDVNYRIEN